ncbi:MAG: hypothetical protein K8S99_03900 [Planctomycetes bacterium]|nr:hypothetical protein [Planctomycetota bacterium]
MDEQTHQFSMDYLAAVALIPNTYLKLSEKIKFAPLQGVAKTFTLNMSRVHSLASFPPSLIAYYCALQLSFTRAVFEVHGHWDSPLSSAPSDAAVAKRRQELGELDKDEKNKRRMTLLDACHAVDLVKRHGGESAFLGIEAILQAQIQGAWTALEAMLADLWVKAVNHGPKSLAKGVWKAQEKSGGLKPEQGQDADKSQEKTIPIQCLSDYGFDLRDRMGDLFVDRKKVDFACLRNIAKAYESAFGSDIANLLIGDTELCADLQMMEVVRNLLAHQAGIVDQMFERHIRKLKKSSVYSMLADTPKATPLPVNGHLSGRFNTVAIDIGLAVILAVDARLSRPDDVKI